MRVGSSRDADSRAQLPSEDSTMTDALDHNNGSEDELDGDEADEMVGQLIDYVSDLTLLP